MADRMKRKDRDGKVRDNCRKLLRVCSNLDKRLTVIEKHMRAKTKKGKLRTEERDQTEKTQMNEDEEEMDNTQTEPVHTEEDAEEVDKTQPEPVHTEEDAEEIDKTQQEPVHTEEDAAEVDNTQSAPVHTEEDAEEMDKTQPEPVHTEEDAEEVDNTQSAPVHTEEDTEEMDKTQPDPVHKEKDAEEMDKDKEDWKKKDDKKPKEEDHDYIIISSDDEEPKVEPKVEPTAFTIQEQQRVDQRIDEWSYHERRNISSMLESLDQILWPGAKFERPDIRRLQKDNAYFNRMYKKVMLVIHPDKVQQELRKTDKQDPEKMYLVERLAQVLNTAKDREMQKRSFSGRF